MAERVFLQAGLSFNQSTGGDMNMLGVGWTLTTADAPVQAHFITAVIESDDKAFQEVPHEFVLALVDANGDIVSQPGEDAQLTLVRTKVTVTPAFDESDPRPPGVQYRNSFTVQQAGMLNLPHGAYKYQFFIDGATEPAATYGFYVPAAGEEFPKARATISDVKFG